MSKPSILTNLSPKAYYVDTKALSYSTLSNYLDNNEIDAVTEFEDNDLARFGRSFHNLFLCRLSGQQTENVVYTLNRKTIEGRAQFEELQRTKHDFFINDELDEARLMTSRFLCSYVQDEKQKELINYFRKNGKIEVSILWKNENGQDFKSRLDYVVLNPREAVADVLDLKTDSNLASKTDRLYWAYRDKNYDLQMYVYCRALLACGYKKINYHGLSIARGSGAYFLTRYGQFDFTFADSYKCEAFQSGEEKYMSALARYAHIQNKLKNNMALSSSMSSGVIELTHPSYER